MASGRLTLSWVGRDQALLNTADGGYEWVTRDDPRVTEVRLLRETGKTGEVTGTPDDNLLIQGDSYDALHALTRAPEYAGEYRGKVKLIYIDPPFNTGQAFDHYDDALEHSVWLTMMRDRLLVIRDLLAPDGSVWVHLDDAEMAYCKVVLDEIFGRGNFVSTIVWETDQGRRNDTAISSVQDYILVYARDKEAWRKTRNLLPRTGEQVKRYKNPDSDPRGPWLQGADSTARSGSDAMRYAITLPSGRVVQPPSGVYWRFSQESFNRALAEDRVYFGKDGDRMPIVKRYLSEVQDGVVPRTWWPSAEVGSNMSAKRDHLRKLFPDIAAFATPKPELLLHRIISIASNPGDIVLDCFAGSGTTAAVAQKMGRRWVTVEMKRETADTFTRPRLEKVVAGNDPGGVTSEVGWQGGGGFRSLQVSQSAYDVKAGRTFLAEWVKEAEFAALAAAQLGFMFESSSVDPFCGRRGRARLAVVDGVVDEVVARGVLGQLDEGERVVLVGRGVAPEVQSLVVNRSPGSQVLKAPRDLVRRGKVVR
ncbi:site-specific DNA-methyltransferase [Streptomyces sp. NPDC056405]|uniref:site-specific DNA-methyltransferase n=1 Tax=Streptomyces sp. NPDC056405 TaxID=3345811 RepID=UPI0035D896D8